MTQCPDCRRFELTEMVEDVTIIKPPEWWGMPLRYWKPPLPLRIKTWLCTLCGWRKERDVP